MGRAGCLPHPEALILSFGASAKIYEKPIFGSTALVIDLKAISENEEIWMELIGRCMFDKYENHTIPNLSLFIERN